MTAEDRAAHVEREAVAGDEAWNPQAHQARLDKYGSTLDRWNVNYVAARIADYPELIEAVERITAGAVLAALPQTGDAAAFEGGVRQAMTWLRADYPYGEGPEWRENGADWIAARLAEHTAALTAGGEDRG